MRRRHLSQIGFVAPSEGTTDTDHPRPQLQRPGWISLDGTWELALDPEGAGRGPNSVRFDRTILVPFSPETQKSGIADTGLYSTVWYRKRTEIRPTEGERVLLHFGAVDYRATVWINGTRAATHEGGYTPFSIDVTNLLDSSGVLEIVVRAEDDPADLAKPRGKQDWQLEPHSIWYPRTTGIWQTVWLERVPASRITHLRWIPSLDRWEIALEARILGEGKLRLRVRLHVGDLVLADDTYSVVAGEVSRRIALSDPGIDDFRNELLWSPASPSLIEADLALLSGDRVIDVVQSYTALRSFDIDGDRLVLNGRPITLRMVLDQGYWPESGLTAPDLGALRRDIELAKAMGFNGIRKHQKIEDPRWLHFCDRLGMLVWEEMPSAYRFTQRSIERVTREWLDVVQRDVSHPCIVAWVPFNESWGVPNLPQSVPERHWVRALYHLTKTMDPSRPVVGNDGWESITTDIIGIHDYDDDVDRIARRYHAHEVRPRLFERERPGGRALVLEGPAAHPIVLSEFGGIALDRNDVWGYSRARDEKEFGERFERLVSVVRSLELFAGFCYTQLADTYQEANGLLRADRTPKIDIDRIRATIEGRFAEARTERARAP